MSISIVDKYRIFGGLEVARQIRKLPDSDPEAKAYLEVANKVCDFDEKIFCISDLVSRVYVEEYRRNQSRAAALYKKDREVFIKQAPAHWSPERVSAQMTYGVYSVSSIADTLTNDSAPELLDKCLKAYLERREQEGLMK